MEIVLLVQKVPKEIVFIEINTKSNISKQVNPRTKSIKNKEEYL
jgi:hypothetical protein